MPDYYHECPMTSKISVPGGKHRPQRGKGGSILFQSL